jgi:competence protein ComGD
MNNNNGFTLIEMMIVLCILTAVTSIVFVSYQSLHERQQTERFFEQLKKDLYFAQQTAMIENTGIQVLFDQKNDNYKVTKSTIPILERSYDSDILIESGSLGLKVVYLSSGNISEPGTINIKTGGDTYDLVFQLGRGRFHIEKQ